MTPLKASIVVDLGFGDSGKGITVDWLCGEALSPKRTLVIRAAGGHQVGHRVFLDGYGHSFSNFGSGSLRGIPTWYSANTTIFPPGMLAEARVLGERCSPLFIHPLAMIATPWDIAWNRSLESVERHGSCGVGYGATVERCRAGVFFAAKDIDCPWIFREKLKSIQFYYEARARSADERVKKAWEGEKDGLKDDVFIRACAEASDLWSINTLDEVLDRFDELVFEGNQGILLDELEGIYPHLSWGSTTSRPALDILAGIRGRQLERVEVFYVTRCYQTRHGAGPMSSSTEVRLVNTEGEANKENPWQGPFRTAELDPDLIRWAHRSDIARQDGLVSGDSFLAGLSSGSRKLCPLSRNLVMTCLDQRPDFDALGAIRALGIAFSRIWGSYSPESKDFKPLSG